MERIKTKLIIAVTNRLSAAADTDAKTDLIEELSDNLYQRYLDLTATGMDTDTAYAKALDDLGDVDELLEYLQNLGPDGQIPKHDGSHFNTSVDDVVRGAEDIVRETISQTKDAVDQAKIIVQDVVKKLKEKYPNGFSDQSYHADSSYTKGGEYRGQNIEGSAWPSANLKRLDINLINGDVHIRINPDPQADVLLAGATEQLDIRLNEEGLLSIRPGKTASSSFFSVRGLISNDVYLTLPNRYWESIFITTVNGDVEFFDTLSADKLDIRSSSGDVDIHRGLETNQMDIRTTSGDVELQSVTGDIRIETTSGDIELTGNAHTIYCSCASGDADIHLSALPENLEVSTKSGDCEIHVPGDLGFTLCFRTVSGNLDTNFSLVGPIAAKSGEAVYLDGGQSVLRLSTISGDISLRCL